MHCDKCHNCIETEDFDGHACDTEDDEGQDNKISWGPLLTQVVAGFTFIPADPSYELAFEAGDIIEVFAEKNEGSSIKEPSFLLTQI